LVTHLVARRDELLQLLAALQGAVGRQHRRCADARPPRAPACAPPPGSGAPSAPAGAPPPGARVSRERGTLLAAAERAFRRCFLRLWKPVRKSLRPREQPSTPPVAPTLRRGAHLRAFSSNTASQFLSRRARLGMCRAAASACARTRGTQHAARDKGARKRRAPARLRRGRSLAAGGSHTGRRDERAAALRLGWAARPRSAAALGSVDTSEAVPFFS
jgi:hypothetical protein